MRRLRHDRRILLYAALAALPAVAVVLLLLWLGDFAPRTRWTLTAVIVLSWIAFASSLWERLVRPLQTVSNLLAAMREGDFSIRARGARAALAGDGRDRRRRLRVRPGREAEADQPRR